MTANQDESQRTIPVRRELKPEPPASLTQRQHACLVYASKGFTLKQSATLQGIAWKTVEIHLANARYKLDATNTIEACCIAMRKGLIP